MRLLLILLIQTFALVAWAGIKTSSLEQCLMNNVNDTALCAQKNIKNLTLSSCYKATENVRSGMAKEDLLGFCFFQVSEFVDMKTCLNHAGKFTTAQNHDDAIFSCVLQFQNNLTSNKCMEISKLIKYPEKKKYLQRNCNNL